MFESVRHLKILKLFESLLCVSLVNLYLFNFISLSSFLCFLRKHKIIDFEFWDCLRQSSTKKRKLVLSFKVFYVFFKCGVFFPVWLPRKCWTMNNTLLEVLWFNYNWMFAHTRVNYVCNVLVHKMSKNWSINLFPNY